MARLGSQAEGYACGLIECWLEIASYSCITDIAERKYDISEYTSIITI